MTTVKSLVVATALLAGGLSVALAQTAPTTGGAPPADVTKTPSGAAAYTGSKSPAIKHHKKMFMSAKSSHKHKSMKMAPAPGTAPAPKQQ
jgi:hypothetical protein